MARTVVAAILLVAGTASGGQEGMGEDVFVTAELSKPEAYVGEQVVLTYRLFTQAPIAGVQVDRLPSYAGFWTEEVEIHGSDWRETEVRGKRFFAVEIKKKVLVPTKTGELAIEAAVFSMSSPGASRSIRRSTRPLTLQVESLPSIGQPRDFSGAVGSFALRALVDRESAAAGDSIALSVIVEGRGNLKTFGPPRLPELPGVRVSDPETVEDLKARPSGYGGEKRWTYALTPSSAGKLRIGPLEFHYFDPERKRYFKLEAGPLVLDVALARAREGEDRALPSDLRELKALPDDLTRVRAPFYRSAPFYASLLVPVVWNLGLLAYRRRRRAELAEPERFRSRRAHRTARRRLQNARKLAREESALFYEELAQALFRYVADKAGESAAALTTRRIGELLEARAVPPPARLGVLSAIEQGEIARFTPGGRSRDEMESLLERAERALVALERHLG